MNIKVLPTKKKPSEINIIVCNAVDYTIFIFLDTYIIFYMEGTIVKITEY